MLALSSIAASATVKIGRLDHLAAPAVQHGLHAVEHRRLVVDAQRGGADELAGIDADVVARRQFDRPPRSTAEP